jgi:hypothetical protein
MMIYRKASFRNRGEAVDRELESATRLQHGQYLACHCTEALFYSTTSDAAERLPTYRQQWNHL